MQSLALIHNIYLQETLLQIFNHHLRLWFYISSKTGIWHQVVRLHNAMTIGVVETIQGGFSAKAEEINTEKGIKINVVNTDSTAKFLC